MLTGEIKAIRAHDIQPGLSSVNMGLVNRFMKKVKLVGATAQVASLIRGHNVLTYEQVEVAAGDLGIDENLLEKVLRELEEMDLVRIIRRSESIQRIEENIPLLHDMYSTIGQRVQDIGLTEIEEASLQLLDSLSLMPMPATDACNAHQLEPDQLEIIKNIGSNTGFMSEYTSPTDGRIILYSPIYWEDNPSKLFELIERYGANQLLIKLKELRNKQGQPVDWINDEIVREAIDLGCLPTPRVDSMAGEKAFAFTPVRGVGRHEKTLLTKARAIVACLRYGEYFGTITKIRSPELFLRRVLERGGTARPHTETLQQWDLCRKLGIGFFDRAIGSSNRYYFRLHETPENRRAMELAIQMVAFGDTERTHSEEEDARALLLAGTFFHPTNTRILVKREGKYSKRNIAIINDLIRGVSSDIFA